MSFLTDSLQSGLGFAWASGEDQKKTNQMWDDLAKRLSPEGMPSRAWDLVNSQEFTQMRKAGYGQGFINDSVRLALAAQRPKIMLNNTAIKTNLAHGGLAFSGMNATADGNTAADLAAVSTGAEHQAWMENENARRQAEGMYFSAASAQDQMEMQGRIAMANIDAQRAANHKGIIDRAMQGAALALNFV